MWINFSKIDDYLVVGDYGWIDNWEFEFLSDDVKIYNEANYYYPKITYNNSVEIYFICG